MVDGFWCLNVVKLKVKSFSFIFGVELVYISLEVIVVFKEELGLNKMIKVLVLLFNGCL